MMKLPWANNLLVIPIQVNALVLEHDLMTSGALADFTKLPYSNSLRDFNPNIANLSEDVVAAPFDNLNLQLSRGVHIHWELPQAFSQKEKNQDLQDSGHVSENSFVKAPNRWLVTKNGSTTEQYIVESNFLHIATDNTEQPFVNVPVSALGTLQKEGSPPFRYLGRSVALGDWNPEGPGDYWSELTAMGYGEPAFSKFYPSCFSVFGFYDASGIDEQTSSYEVIGWYQDPESDPLASVLKQNQDLDQQGKLEAISAYFDGDHVNETEIVPQQSICYGVINMVEKVPAQETESISITCSDSASGAMMAMLSDKMDGFDHFTQSQREEQLSALLLKPFLDNESSDYYNNLQGQLLKKGFAAYQGGSSWVLRSVGASKGEQVPEVPYELGALLNELNEAQSAYNRTQALLYTRQQQLFSDWYKYMICNYPPLGQETDFPNPDEVRYFIEQTIKEDLMPLLEQLGSIEYAKDDAGKLTGANTNSEGSVVGALVAAINAIIPALVQYDTEKGNSIIVELEESSESPYYQPSEPHIMIEGLPNPVSQTSDWKNFAVTVIGDDVAAQYQSLSTQMKTLIAKDPKHSGSNEWKNNQSDLTFFEWQVAFNPSPTNSISDPNYESGYITSNFDLQEGTHGLYANNPESITENGDNIYNGRSYLGRQAGSDTVKASLEAYLLKHVVSAFKEKQNLDQTGQEILQGNLDELIDYSKANLSPLSASATKAYSIMQSTPPSSQILNGFNDLLLMHKLTLQLAVADPLGFEWDQQFASVVSSFVGGNIRNAPQPLVDFNPIRGGSMTMNQLYLVDRFGQTAKVNMDQVKWVSSISSTVVGNQKFSIPVRYSQPARLNCHWLDSKNGDKELNQNPATSPICGWLLPNNLDSSLMVYDQEGKSLGAIDSNSTWQPNPGDINPVSVSQIANTYLQDVVQYLIKQGSTYQKAFLAALNSGLENSEPENFRQHLSLAILMGRPIAVTRISLSLEVFGDYATDQSWNAFRSTLENGTRATNGFENVNVPIQLGDYKQLNDGVIGFWQEPFSDQPVFNAIQSDGSPSEGIVTHDNTKPIPRALSDEALTLTMLMDPRGKLHAFSGLLPTEVLEIPPYFYAEALKKIQIGFLSSPVLTGENIALPISDEPGYGWSFNQLLSDGSWHKWARQGIVTLSQVSARFGNGQSLWQELLTNNWIVTDSSIVNEEARIVPKDQRKTPTSGPLLAMKVAMESWLDDKILGTPDGKARFLSNVVIREGWLKLTPNTDMVEAVKQISKED